MGGYQTENSLYFQNVVLNAPETLHIQRAGETKTWVIDESTAQSAEKITVNAVFPIKMYSKFLDEFFSPLNLKY